MNRTEAEKEQADTNGKRNDEVTPERDWRTMGIVELAVENQSVADYIQHWEHRALTAEADIIERAGGQDAAKEVGVREVAATAYQICGALEAPARILDYFSAVASGEAAENPLPFTPERPCGETAWVSELLAATKMMCESLPLYSPSSAAFMRKERLDVAIKAAEKFCAGGSLKSAIGVKADLEHPGNDTGGESAESLLPSPPTAEGR